MTVRRPRALATFGFFLVLLAWIATKVAYSFRGEFPEISLLCKWDCGWYESIARQGYLSPIPPLFQDSEHSNVAFFPAYPLLGRLAALLLGVPPVRSLPVVSIVFAVLVSAAIARLIASESRASRLVRLAILVAYPATFYLFVSYSESVYLAAMLAGASLFLDGAEKRSGVGFAMLGAFGVVLGATRLTGFVIPFFLLAAAALFAWVRRHGRRGGALSVAREEFTARAALFLGGAAAGSLAFFAFCALRFGHWNLYFWQVSLGWYKEFSPAKAWVLLTTHPFPPSLDYQLLQVQSRSLSWMVIATLTGFSVYIAIRAFFTAKRALTEGDRSNFLRCALAYAAIVHLFIVVCGDVGPWDAWGNGLRYPMPTVFLFAVAWRDEWTPTFIRENRVARFVAYVALAVVLAFLFRNQVGYLDRFIRNEWVS
ncbi:MAG: hypothetical protein JST04_04090 [Bdellovibrionales bacterium]|nr:hypothetical protein [Bdellovibrionales bacterium]